METRSIHALSLTSNGYDWLANSSQSRILHIFDRACNLVNEHGDIFSIVTQQIGNGPFNLVIDDSVDFTEFLDVDAPVVIQDSCLQFGSLTINTTGAELWSPRPNWEILHDQQANILGQIAKLPITNYQPSLPHVLLSTFSTSIATADIPCCITSAKQLAGLGQGLTPSGDDFILGALYAAWIIHPPEMARSLAQEVANTAAPLTTSLSAAWLSAAGKGETGILWHEFFDALLSADTDAIQIAMENILAVGATSGADALSGFISSLVSDRVKIQHG